jgi:hypothetical protein
MHARAEQYVGLPMRLAVTIAAAVACFVLAPLSVTAQRETGLYRADEFGIFFFYDASVWQIVDEETEPGSAYVSFSDGATVASYWAFDAPGMSAGNCLGLVLDGLAADSSVLAVEDLLPQGTPPEITDYETSASMEIVVTVDVDGAREKYASEERCQALTPGQSLLYRASSVPAAVFNEIQEFPSPWSIGVEFVVITGETGPVPIPGAAGTLDAYLHCAESTFPVVARTMSAAENFVIDPDGFWVAFEEGTIAPARLARGQYPQQLGTTSFVLPPEEIGLFELRIEQFPDVEFPLQVDYDLYYQPLGAEPVFLGHYSGPCYGGGGGSPILIDLEE